VLRRQSFRLEKDLLRALDVVRKRLGLSKTDYIRRAMRASLHADIALLASDSADSDAWLIRAITAPHSKRPSPRTPLSPALQLKGVQAALQSPRTPEQLKPGLRERAAKLEALLAAKGNKP
jgi:hypothetical protein